MTPADEARIEVLETDIFEARDLAHSLFHQACLVHPNSSEDPIKEFQYDHECTSTYEYAQQKLLEWGLIKPEECLRK